MLNRQMDRAMPTSTGTAQSEAFVTKVHDLRTSGGKRCVSFNDMSGVYPIPPHLMGILDKANHDRSWVAVSFDAAGSIMVKPSSRPHSKFRGRRSRHPVPHGTGA